MFARIKSTLFSIGTAILIAVLDIWSKQHFFILANDRALGSIPPNILRMTWHKNLGITANILIPRSIIIAITCAVIVGMVVELVKAHRTQSILYTLGFGCVIGGALGNLADRIHLGYVRDWLLLFNISIINLADIAIVIGIGLLFIDYTRQHVAKPA